MVSETVLILSLDCTRAYIYENRPIVRDGLE
jgi:hypothetical protein